MAKYAKNRLNIRYSNINIIFHDFENAGPIKRQNKKYRKNFIFNIDAGTFTAGHYLFFVDWDIDESDGPCRLRVTETIQGKDKIRNGKGDDFTEKNGPLTPDYGTAWTKDYIKEPNCLAKVENKEQKSCCKRKLIYVDAPGGHAYTKRFLYTRSYGFEFTVNATYDILDKNNASVYQTKVSVSIGVAQDGTLSSSP